MTRGQVAYTDADPTQAIAALGISESTMAGHEAFVTTAVTSDLERLKIVSVPAESNTGDTLLEVAGIEVGDTIISAVGVAYVGGELVTEDYTGDATVTDENEITLADAQVASGTILQVVYVDLTRPSDEGA